MTASNYFYIPRELRLRVDFSALLQEFFSFFLQPDFQRSFIANAMLSGEFADILRDFHTASAFAKATAGQENAIPPHAFE